MTKLEQMKSRALDNSEVRQEYESLKAEFELIDQLLKMRTAAGLTQEQLAQRMGTQISNISRLEKGNANPRIDTLKSYAKACGFVYRLDFTKRTKTQ